MKPSWLPLAELSSSLQKKRKLIPMDEKDISVATSVRGTKQHFNKKGRNWRKRLHLRKAAVKPPTMQSKDKCGPKKIAEEWEQSKVWPSTKKTSEEESQRVTNHHENMLRFKCCQCIDNVEYSPKDLMKHFEDKHIESPPVFSCHMCTFCTHDFSYLQIHLLSHKDTFSSCSFCNDRVQRTWSEFSAHLTMCHFKNGKYSCETCHGFSTGDVRVFLEHLCLHNLGLSEVNDNFLFHTMEKNMSGNKSTTLCCQHCGFQASHKWLLTKHIKTTHACQNGDRRQKKKEINSAMEPNELIPKMNPRLTRSAVREMCWLTQDCLSLPGREFLDKYCPLADPQTTLEETKQFLMKSVTVEAGDKKWTKALKTVLSNVPQDMTLHPKSENCIMSISPDLTVLTVKNKITVSQNGATYAKRLKKMATSDKESVVPESAFGNRLIVDQNGCQSTVNDNLLYPQHETKLHNDVLVSAQSETTESTQMEENEIPPLQDVESDMEIKEDKDHMPDNIVDISPELNLTNECKEQMSIQKDHLLMGENQFCTRNTTSTRVDRKSTGIPLRIVLKKNPVKEKQWVSESVLSPTVADSMAQILENTQTSKVHQPKLTKTSNTDLDEAITSMSQQAGSENIDGCEPDAREGLLSENENRSDASGKVVQFYEMGDHKRISAAKTTETNITTVAGAEEKMSPNNVRLVQTSDTSTVCHKSNDKRTSAAETLARQSGFSESCLGSQPVITPQGEVTQLESSPAVSSEHSNHKVELVSDREGPVESCSKIQGCIFLPEGEAIQPEPSLTFRHQVQKNQERTLRLVAINPSQLVKRPAGDQPVVVLNHPDAEIPEVSKIMEVVNRYKGEVNKVILSHRTLNALSSVSSEHPQAYDPVGMIKNSVKERFILKLKFRRLNRKKYEVVGAASLGGEVATSFRCWFCGRVFVCQEMWMVHRQRHLLEWKRQNCENS